MGRVDRRTRGVDVPTRRVDRSTRKAEAPIRRVGGSCAPRNRPPRGADPDVVEARRHPDRPSRAA